MGLCGSNVKIPENFQGPFVFTGDSNGVMRQHAFKNNKLKLIKKYFQVHKKESGGIKVMASTLNDELLTTLDGNGLIQVYATSRQLRIFNDRFVELKLTTAITYSTDNKFAFLGNKFGKINQWDNVKKSIFNIWHFVTPGRTITSMFCSKIINPDHQMPEYFNHILNVATNKGEILQFSIPNSTITDQELLHTYEGNHVADGKGTVETHSNVGIHGTTDYKTLFSQNKQGDFKQWSLVDRILVKDHGKLQKIKQSNAFDITEDASYALFAVKKLIIVFDIQASVFVGSYSISNAEINTLVCTRTLYSEEDKCALPHGKWKAMINKVDHDCDDKMDRQPGNKQDKSNWFVDGAGSILNLANSISSPGLSPNVQGQKYGGFYEIEGN